MVLGVIGSSLATTPPARAACGPDAGWVEMCALNPRPSARFGAAMAAMPDPLNPTRSLVVLFGGCASTVSTTATARFEDGSAVSADFAYCPSKVGYGFGATTNTSGETWVWNGTRWTKVVQPAGTAWPHARWGGAMGYDRTTGRLVLFGGIYQTTTPTAADVDPDLVSCWSAKQVMLPDAAGVVRYQRSKILSVSIPHGTKTVGVSSYCMKDTWLFDGSTWTRAPSSPAGPAARFDHAIASGAMCAPAGHGCGATSGLVTIVSGCSGLGMIGSHGAPDRAVYWDCVDYAGTESLYTVTDTSTGIVKERKVTMSDTWSWSGAGSSGTWTRLCPSVPGDAGTCEPISGKAYDCSTPRVETTGLSLCAPNARRGASATYDPKTGAVVLFGGYYYDPVWNYRPALADTWEWDQGLSCPDTNDGDFRSGPCWRLIMATWKATAWATPHPGARAWGSAVTAGVGAEWHVILFGGRGTNTLYALEGITKPPPYDEGLHDTWIWLDGAAGGCTDGTGKYDTTCWQPCADCLASPPASRWSVGMAYDAGDGEVVLFGGVCTSGCTSGYAATSFDDTWALTAPPPAT